MLLDKGYTFPPKVISFLQYFLLTGHMLLLILSVCLLMACERDQETIQVNLEKRQPVQAKKPFEGLTYAYLPQYSHKVAYTRHNPLVAYLCRKTNLNIRQIFPDTFDEHIKMVGQGQIDISFSNPFIYIQTAREYGAKAFARIVENNGRAKFRGQIICRQDNKAIETLHDCRGKSWIAVDPSSAGGYLFPLGCFLKHGISRDDFREIAFAPGPGGKQEKVVIAVFLGDYDIGSIREGTLELVQDRIDPNSIHVLASTEWYPGWVYAARKGLDASVVRKIEQALLLLNTKTPEEKVILEQAGFKGIIPAKDKDFDPVRELVQAIGMQ